MSLIVTSVPDGMLENMRVVGYARSSIGELWADLDAQMTAIRRGVIARGWELTTVFYDGGLSRTEVIGNRLTAALTVLARRDADALAVAKLDRLTGSMLGLSELLERFQRNR